MSENQIAVAGETGLMTQSELYEPLMYYGVTPRIVIDYVSDIHLLHHVRFFDHDLRRTVRTIAKSLYDSHLSSYNKMTFHERKKMSWDVPIFLGDVSTDKNVTVDFFRQYRMNAIHAQYKRFKHLHMSESKSEDAKRRRDFLAGYIEIKNIAFEQMRHKINKHISYNRVITPKGDLDKIKAYLDGPHYKKRNLPPSVKKDIVAAATLKDEITRLEGYKYEQDFIIADEAIRSETKLSDFRYHFDGPLGLVILGNHEYVDFPDVDEAVKFYKAALEPMGYVVLQNEYIENDNVVIYGGSGFAKYSESYNANNLICCAAMEGNRAYEIEQTTLFEKGYEAAKEYAIKTEKCFVCAAHYPVESCLGKFDPETVYFTGHTHKNERIRTEKKVLYADNQIGYHNNGRFDGMIRFKTAKMDSTTNPYAFFEDGYYQTTPEDYLRFYEYIGEYIGEGKLIRKRCETGELYVIKSLGYYGFFVVNKSGISIVNGGKTKRISLNKNIDWIYSNFNIVVNKYLAVLEPLFMVQMQISQELKRLGFQGSIHGLIVDIDYYNHVMVNPIDGSVTFYYSPWFGEVQQFESFRKQLEFMNDKGLLEGQNVDVKSLKTEDVVSECDALALRSSNALTSIENNGISNEMMLVSRTEGAYGVSRAINPLQRLFTGHVLRDFDLRLVEIADENTTTRRAQSMLGRVCCNCYHEALLVIKDDLGEFIELLDEHGDKSVVSVVKLRSSMRGPCWSSKKWWWVTKNIDETIEKYKGRRLPKPWRNAIQLMQPKKLEAKKQYGSCPSSSCGGRLYQGGE